MQEWQKKLQQLQAWWQTPLGEKLLAIEQRFLAEQLECAFGYQLVLIADESFAALSNYSRMSQVLRINPLTETVKSLPENIDAIIIPHSLNYLPNPEAWFEAIHNKLDSNGKLIFTTFSYLSYLGLQKARYAKCVRQLPTNIHSFSALRNSLLKSDFSLTDDCCFAAGRTLGLDNDKLLMNSLWGNLSCIIATKKLLTVKNFETEWEKKSINSEAVMNSYIGENRQHER